VTPQKCPKCFEMATFTLFDDPDIDGTIGMFTHNRGFKTVNTPMGPQRVADSERHFVTYTNIKNLPWLEGWKAERDKIRKKIAKENDEKWEREYAKQCEEEFY